MNAEENNTTTIKSEGKILTQEYLLECFRYEPETGLLYWRERPLHHFNNIKNRNSLNGRYMNKLVNSISVRGYNNVSINRKSYGVHRIIWKMVYGEEPNIIDHINGIKNDNRICNLRNVSQKENARNRAVLNSRNTSGYYGVSFIPTSGKYSSKLYVEGVPLNLGNYNTLEEAALVRELKFKEVVGDEFYTSCNRDKLLNDLIIKVKEIEKEEKVISHRYFNNKTKSNNISGYVGVFYLRDRNKWIAEIKKDGKKYNSPQQNTPEEAAYYRELKCIELYGEEYYNKMGRNTLLEELKLKVEEIIRNR